MLYVPCRFRLGSAAACISNVPVSTILAVLTNVHSDKGTVKRQIFANAQAPADGFTYWQATSLFFMLAKSVLVARARSESQRPVQPCPTATRHPSTTRCLQLRTIPRC